MSSGIAELLANHYVPRILAGILGVILIFFAVVSVVLLYHWKKYESVNSGTILMAVVYFGVSVILFGGSAYYLFLFIK